MIKKTVRAGHEQEDIQLAREALDLELKATEKALIVIRRDNGVDAFAGKVTGRAGASWREAIWLKVDDDVLLQVLTTDEYNDWFHGYPETCSVALDENRNVSARLIPTASNYEIEDAYLAAEV